MRRWVYQTGYYIYPDIHLNRFTVDYQKNLKINAYRQPGGGSFNFSMVSRKTSTNRIIGLEGAS